MNFGLTLGHQKNSLKRCGNGVVFRADLLQPLILYLAATFFKQVFKRDIKSNLRIIRHFSIVVD